MEGIDPEITRKIPENSKYASLCIIMHNYAFSKSNKNTRTLGAGHFPPGCITSFYYFDYSRANMHVQENIIGRSRCAAIIYIKLHVLTKEPWEIRQPIKVRNSGTGHYIFPLNISRFENINSDEI